MEPRFCVMAGFTPRVQTVISYSVWTPPTERCFGLTVNGDSVLMFTDQGVLIRARLDRDGCHEISRVKLIEPTYAFSGRKITWAAPAFADRHVFVRNERELICASLANDPLD